MRRAAQGQSKGVSKAREVEIPRDTFRVGQAGKAGGETTHKKSWRREVGPGLGTPVFPHRKWGSAEQFQAQGLKVEGHADVITSVILDDGSGHLL